MPEKVNLKPLAAKGGLALSPSKAVGGPPQQRSPKGSQASGRPASTPPWALQAVVAASPCPAFQPVAGTAGGRGFTGSRILPAAAAAAAKVGKSTV